MLAGVCAAALLVGGPSKPVLILIVLCSPAVTLIVPELFLLWEWFVGKAEAHAVDREERLYRYGYTDIRMLMADDRPWFAAADIAGALGLADVGHEIRHFDAARCRILGDGNERYVSEAGVMTLIGRSRHADVRSFRTWFTREVMTPLNRARRSREEEPRAGGEG